VIFFPISESNDSGGHSSIFLRGIPINLSLSSSPVGEIITMNFRGVSLIVRILCLPNGAINATSCFLNENSFPSIEIMPSPSKQINISSLLS